MIVGVLVGVIVTVGVMAGVLVGVNVMVGVMVGVLVGVNVTVGVMVEVLVGVNVMVGVGVGVEQPRGVPMKMSASRHAASARVTSADGEKVLPEPIERQPAARPIAGLFTNSIQPAA